MTRRANGDGGLSWDKRRQRWIAATTVGYDGRGKRIVRRGSGRTKTEAKAKLRALLRDRDDGVMLGAENYTVGQAVEDGLRSAWVRMRSPRRGSIGSCARSTSNSVSGPNSRSTQLPMCASSGSTWRRARSSL